MVTSTLPRKVLTCTYPGCGQVWMETSDNHARTIRRAVQRGWTGDDGGCLCICTGVLCPEHSEAKDR